MDNGGITAQVLPQTQRGVPQVPARTEAYENLGKLNIIIVLLSRFSLAAKGELTLEHHFGPFQTKI